jgi:glycosyltransferase involved in cell wall biosynthesis
VICQINTHFHFSHTYSAIPPLIRYPLRALEKLSGLSFGRLYQILSNFFVRLRLQTADVVFFHPPTRFEGAIRKAKQRGSIVVGIATVAHPLFDKEIHESEHQRFGSSLPTENFERMSALIEQSDYIVAISDFVKSFTNPRKGLPYLLDAWKKLALPHAELVLVGKYSPDTPEKLRRYCDDIIRSDSSITWAGNTQDPTPYYKEASIFVLPSLSEGNPRVVMEAMAHGLPVITTPNAQKRKERICSANTRYRCS